VRKKVIVKAKKRMKKATNKTMMRVSMNLMHQTVPESLMMKVRHLKSLIMMRMWSSRANVAKLRVVEMPLVMISVKTGWTWMSQRTYLIPPLSRPI
jgi:hypothetical protein